VPGVSKPGAKSVAISKAKRQIHHRAKVSSGQRRRRLRSAESEPRARRTGSRKPKPSRGTH
jgi:hypothetical protein